MRIKRSDLEDALMRTRRAIQNNNTMPILTHVLIDPYKGKMVGTDLEVWAMEEMEITNVGKKPNAFTVNGKKLSEVVKSLPKDIQDVTITLSKKRDVESVHVHGTTLTTLPADEYPVMPDFLSALPVEIEAGGLPEIIKRVLPAVGEDSERYALMSVHVDLEKGEMASTDGHRLHVTHFKGRKGGHSFMIPSGAARVVAALKGNVSLFRQKNKDSATLSVFKHENGVVVSREMDGEFPDYKQSIPEKSEIQISIDKEDLKEKIVQGWPVSSVGEGKNPGKMEFKENKLTLSSFNPEVGKFVSEDIQCEINGGLPKEGLKIAFNLKFILDALSSLEGDKVFMNFKDPVSPMKMTEPLTDPNKETIAVVMPMNL